MMNRSEENQNGCREQTRNEDEGIDGILEELMAHVCDMQMLSIIHLHSI